MAPSRVSKQQRRKNRQRLSDSDDSTTEEESDETQRLRAASGSQNAANRIEPLPSTATEPRPEQKRIHRQVLESRTVLLDPNRCVNGSRVRPVSKKAVEDLKDSLQREGWVALSAPVIHYQAERIDLQHHFLREQGLSEAESTLRTEQAIEDGDWASIVEGNHRLQAVRELADDDDPETRKIWSEFLVPSILTEDTSREFIQSFAIALNTIQSTSTEQTYVDELIVYKNFLESHDEGTPCVTAAKAFLSASTSFSGQTKTGKAKKLTTLSQDMAKAKEVSMRALRYASDIAATKDNRKSLLNHNNMKFVWKDLPEVDQISLIQRMDFTAHKKMPIRQEALALKTGLLAAKAEIAKFLSFCKYDSITDTPIQVAAVLRRSLSENRLDKDAIANESSATPCQSLMAVLCEHDPARYAHAVNTATAAQEETRQSQARGQGDQLQQAQSAGENGPGNDESGNVPGPGIQPGCATSSPMRGAGGSGGGSSPESVRPPEGSDPSPGGFDADQDPGHDVPPGDQEIEPANPAQSPRPPSSQRTPQTQRRVTLAACGITTVNAEFQHFQSTSTLFSDSIQRKVDLVLTDIPYSGVNSRSATSTNLLSRQELIELTTLIGASLKDSGNAVVFCSHRELTMFEEIARDCGLKASPLPTYVTRDRSKIPRHSIGKDTQNCMEMFVVLYKDYEKRYVDLKSNFRFLPAQKSRREDTRCFNLISNVAAPTKKLLGPLEDEEADGEEASQGQASSPGSRRRRRRPIRKGEKNIALLKDLIIQYCPEVTTSLVFDPLAGTMTSAIAALELGMQSVSVEKDKLCYDLAVERLEQKARSKLTGVAEQPRPSPGSPMTLGSSPRYSEVLGTTPVEETDQNPVPPPASASPGGRPAVASDCEAPAASSPVQPPISRSLGLVQPQEPAASQQQQVHVNPTRTEEESAVTEGPGPTPTTPITVTARTTQPPAIPVAMNPVVRARKEATAGASAPAIPMAEKRARRGPTPAIPFAKEPALRARRNKTPAAEVTRKGRKSTGLSARERKRNALADEAADESARGRTRKSFRVTK